MAPELLWLSRWDWGRPYPGALARWL